MSILRRCTSALLAVLLSTACSGGDGGAGAPADRPAFDGREALALVRKQVAFGPRVPGTPGHAAQLDWMLARLDTLADAVEADTFTHVTTAGDSLSLTNVLARFRPGEGRRIVLVAHWDTRPTSDRAADSTLRDVPVPGANDGGSGTAVLLELAELFAQQPPPVGVDLLLVDGEDYGPGTEDMFLGAKRYAEGLPPVTATGAGRPIYGILLDMVGDADASFPAESYSVDLAPAVVSKIRAAARRVGHDDLFPRWVGRGLYDDHIPLNDAGLPTANVIDFTFGPDNRYWHTPEDTPDKLSAETLEAVGEVVAELVYSGG